MKTESNGAGARYTAEVTPASSVDLAFKVSGYVERVASVRGVDGRLRLLQEGDPVSRGAELAKLQTQDHLNKLHQAQAAFVEANAAQEQAELELQRATELHASNALAPADLERARVRLNMSEARGASAKGRVEEAQSSLVDARIMSPMDGVLVRRNVEIGSFVATGMPAFSVADTRTIRVVFGVADSVRAALELGRMQLVTTEALPDEQFWGRVTRIASVADPKNSLFTIEITVDNAAGLLKAGMITTVSLWSSPDSPVAAVVPLSALVRPPNATQGFAVFVLDEASWPPIVHLRNVELGEFLGNVVPVQRGLHLGEKVAVQGASLLSDLEPVRVIP